MRIETNVIGTLKGTSKRVYAIIALFILSLLVGIFAYSNRSILRDFVVANYAHYKAGAPIPFDMDEVGYIGGLPYNKDYSWGIMVNSEWMSQYIRLVVPYMTYEGLTSVAYYPTSAAIYPFQGFESFHVAGRMVPGGGKYAIFLNERIFVDDHWNDQRMALEVLTHELIHGQGGAFLQGTSPQLESATSTATVEVLAAMCNYGDKLACKSFWWNFEHLARTSLLLQLYDKGAGNLYEIWANTFWRNADEEAQYEKGMRRWAEDMDALMVLRSKYSLVPYQRITKAMTEGFVLNTGNAECSQVLLWDKPTCIVMGLEFDDTFVLLHNLLEIFKLGE